MILILIVSAVLALLFLTAGSIFAGRNAISLYRTTREFQRRTEPLVFKTMHLVEVVQNRAMMVMDKADILQRRVYLLSIALQPMKILASSWQRATGPVNRARAYVGL